MSTDRGITHVKPAGRSGVDSTHAGKERTHDPTRPPGISIRSWSLPCNGLPSRMTTLAERSRGEANRARTNRRNQNAKPGRPYGSPTDRPTPSSIPRHEAKTLT